jgi:hypothetical protein
VLVDDDFTDLDHARAAHRDTLAGRPCSSNPTTTSVYNPNTLTWCVLGHCTF